MTQVVKIAKIGKSTNSTDPNDFIFHSSYNTFKIILEGTRSITLVASTNNQTFSQAHGLDLIPVPAAFAKQTGVDQVFLPNGMDVDLWGAKLGFTGDVKFNYVSSDSTNINFNFDNASGSSIGVNIRYFALEKVN